MRRGAGSVFAIGAVALLVVVTVLVKYHQHNPHSPASADDPDAKSNGGLSSLLLAWRGSASDSVDRQRRGDAAEKGSSALAAALRQAAMMSINDVRAAAFDYDFTWSIFITPEGFTGQARRRQTRALDSWVRLKPRPRIVLVGQGEGYSEIAKEYDCEINPQLDMNFILMPLAGSLIDTAMKAETEISVILNSDILLTQSFVDGLAKVRMQFTDWFLAGARYDLADLPPIYEPGRSDFHEEGFITYVRTKGILHSAGGQDYFAWNNNGKRLFHGTMPPFIRGKSKFDNWFVHEVIHGGYRDVIDGTSAITAVHVNHNYISAEGKETQADKIGGADGKGTFWMKAKTSDWQIFHNVHLAIFYGSYRNQDGTTEHAPYKLASCLEPTGMCLLKRVRPGVCKCELNTYALNTQSDPAVVNVIENNHRKTIIKCGSVSVDNFDSYAIPTFTPRGSSPKYGLPFTMEDLLPIVARDNHVVVTGVSYIYRDTVMNFVCNLRRLGIYSHLILAAFDEEMYKFGFKMGLPIFLYKSDLFSSLSSRDLEYGSDAFKKVTKMKSRVVLDILKLGYDVTWTDTDITWFKNPIPRLEEIARNSKSDFVVQSNAPWPDEAVGNGPLRINSGFYHVKSTPIAIAAMTEIVNHATTSRYTEQPSFYIVLCGGMGGTNRLGDKHCQYTYTSDSGESSTLLVEFLDRQEYPNGSVGGYWQSQNIAEEHPQIVILHNNWIKGLRAKTQRQVEKGLWYYNREMEICNYEPHPVFEFNWSVDES